MPELALVLWAVYFVPTLGVRVALQLRRTGRTGFASGARRSATQSAGQLLETVAIGLGVAAPILALGRSVEPIGALDKPALHVLGVALFAVGLVGIVVSQEAMGASWRIGVDTRERTELVQTGPFAYVRNPIFSGLLLVQAGTALMVPSVVALAGPVLQLLAVEIQVRLVEEPYLARVHGPRYEEYRRRVGRLLPRVGRGG